MKTEINLLELFSGIGGFALGLQDAGFNLKSHQFSEIDKHAIANYKYNFNNAKHIGSVTDVRGHRGQADIITFGSPCQDFSLAGKRAGMEGQRSSLILEAIRLISEIQPSVFIWENVKGAFSSNDGADFWAILNAFTNIGNYRLEWQLLNTSWFLPQNRERIYLVGHFAGRSIGNVFPFTENDGLFGIAPNSGKGQSQAKHCSTITDKFGNRADSTFVRVSKIAGCLIGGGHSGGLHSDMTVIPVLTPNRTEKRQNDRRFKENGEPAFTLNCQDQHGILVTQLNLSKESNGTQPYQQNRIYAKEGISPTLDQSAGRWQTNTSTIRRLTEIECERLQGFPDNWTMFGDYNGKIKEIPKTQRYKMLGNAVTVKVVEEIGKRLNIN